jgi:hypothetical protein
MLRVSGLLLGFGLLLSVACERAADVAAPPPSRASGSAEPMVSGMWNVEGVTVETASGKTRQISGTIILAQEGDRYTSTFDLDTALPSEGGPVHANVIGEGEGTVEGRTLSGKTNTQIIISGAPNVDPGFAYVPRRVGTRIVSKTKAVLADDGTITIEIESEPAPGETYASTRTRSKVRTRSRGELLQNLERALQL